MTYRLTNFDRESINSRMVEHALKDRKIAHALAGDALAKAILAQHIKGKEEIFNKIPKEWLNTRDYFCVKFDDYAGWVYARFLNGSTAVPRDIDVKEEFSSDDPLYPQVQSFVEEERSINEEKSIMEEKIMGILSTCSTDKKLLEIWPEVQPFLSEKVVYTPNLPVNLKDLNKQIGLPIKETV